MGVRILAVGKALPAKSISNTEISSFLNTNDEWITSHTGIQSRYVFTDENATDLASQAAVEALNNADLQAEDIDLLIGVTLESEYIIPSMASAISEKLNINCPAFDINAACSGFIYALDLADALITAKKVKTILLVCCEEMSRHVDWTDRSTCILFGDGAGAVILGSGNALRYSRLTNNGNTHHLRLKSIKSNSPFRVNQSESRDYLHMDGQEVFRFAVQSLEREIKLALKTLDMTPDQIDYFILHQANRRIIESARQKLNQPQNKFPMNIEHCGNISAASIPILLEQMITENKINTGNVLLLSAFGGGLTTGTCVLVWE